MGGLSAWSWGGARALLLSTRGCVVWVLEAAVLVQGLARASRWLAADLCVT